MMLCRAYLQGGLELHRSTAQSKLKPAIGSTFQLAQNVIPYLIAVSYLQSNTSPI